MARAGIEQYLYFLDAAFAGPDWHSLLTNVRALEPEDWLWLPPDGARPIAEMVAHVGACKTAGRGGVLSHRRAHRLAGWSSVVCGRALTPLPTIPSSSVSATRTGAR